MKTTISPREVISNVCVEMDGWRLSVAIGHGAYCSPRTDSTGEFVVRDGEDAADVCARLGYTEVELAFLRDDFVRPSAVSPRLARFDELFADDDVAGYVPVSTLREILGALRTEVAS